MTDTLQARLREYRERHETMVPGDGIGKDWCYSCRDNDGNSLDGPCDAAKLVDALEVAVGEIADLSKVYFPSNALEPVPWYAKKCKAALASIEETLK